MFVLGGSRSVDSKLRGIVLVKDELTTQRILRYFWLESSRRLSVVGFMNIESSSPLWLLYFQVTAMTRVFTQSVVSRTCGVLILNLTAKMGILSHWKRVWFLDVKHGRQIKVHGQNIFYPKFLTVWQEGLRYLPTLSIHP